MCTSEQAQGLGAVPSEVRAGYVQTCSLVRGVIDALLLDNGVQELVEFSRGAAAKGGKVLVNPGRGRHTHT